MSFRTLVDAVTLSQNLNRPDWVVIDCRFNLMDPEQGQRAYVEGHLPGAHYAHLEADLSGPVTSASGRHPLPDPAALKACFGAWGITPETQVVAYDDAGGAMAGRLWWLLRWMGHDRVALLDGGLGAWLRQGLPLSDQAAVALGNEFSGSSADSAVVTTETVLDNLREECFLLVDARSPERFRGEQEPIDPVAGRVPGALNRPLQANLAADGCFLPAAQLREEWQALLKKWQPEQVVHMCGSGITGCHNLFAMEHAGLTGSRLYAGSWSEWIRDRQRPVATTGP